MADNRFLKSHQFIFQKRKKKEERKGEKERKKGARHSNLTSRLLAIQQTVGGLGGRAEKLQLGAH